MELTFYSFGVDYAKSASLGRFCLILQYLTVNIFIMSTKGLSNKNKSPETTDQRKYIRLNVVFPVEFQFIDT